MSDIDKLLRQMNKMFKQFNEVHTAYKNYEFSLIAESDESDLDEAECEMFAQEDTALKEQFAEKIRGLQRESETLLTMLLCGGVNNGKVS